MNKHEAMKNAGLLVAEIFYKLKEYIKPGSTVKEINELCALWMKENGAKSAALGYKGFKNYVCVSINEVVCHGQQDSIISKGDIVSVDIALELNSFYGDSCFTYICEKTSPLKEKLVKVAYETMWIAIENIKAGIKTGDLGFIMQDYAEKQGFNVIRDFCGHGIGEKMHMEPMIPFYGKKNTGEVLQVGTYITIEPMLCTGKPKIEIHKDGWTAIMRDKGMSAQFEHTVCVLNGGYEVLTFNKFDLEQKKTKMFIKL